MAYALEFAVVVAVYVLIGVAFGWRVALVLGFGVLVAMATAFLAARWLRRKRSLG